MVSTQSFCGIHKITYVWQPTQMYIVPVGNRNCLNKNIIEDKLPYCIYFRIVTRFFWTKMYGSCLLKSPWQLRPFAMRPASMSSRTATALWAFSVAFAICLMDRRWGLTSCSGNSYGIWSQESNSWTFFPSKHLDIHIDIIYTYMHISLVTPICHSCLNTSSGWRAVASFFGKCLRWISCNGRVISESKALSSVTIFFHFQIVCSWTLKPLCNTLQGFKDVFCVELTYLETYLRCQRCHHKPPPWCLFFENSAEDVLYHIVYKCKKM